MNEFQKKLNAELHKYKGETSQSFYEIADELEIHHKRMYAFTSGNRGLNNKDVAKLMGYLGLTVKMENNEKSN